MPPHLDPAVASANYAFCDDRRCRAAPCPPDTPEKRRRRWRCGSSCRPRPICMDCCCAVAAADDGGGVALSHRLGHSQGARCQSRVLEDAHGAVPDNGLGSLDGLSKQLAWSPGRCRRPIHVGRDLRSTGTTVVSTGASMGSGKSLDADGIDRQEQLDALLLEPLPSSPCSSPASSHRTRLLPTS